MDSKARQIMDALTARLTGIPGVNTLILDSARVANPLDGVCVFLDLAGDSTDQISVTCKVDTTLPIIVTGYRKRAPTDPPNWQLLDPLYIEIHSRMMNDKTLGGLCLDMKADGRSYLGDLEACEIRCRYTVQYRTLEADVTQ